MKKLGLLLLVFCATLIVSAADNKQFVLQVVPESAFLRALPDEAAAPAGSVFANDSLIAVGRNMDGEWLEVQRTGFNKSGGWIARKLTAFTFSVGELPITDGTTGLLGTEPVVDSGISILMINDGHLRSAPSRYAAEISAVPINMTLPVIARTPDNQWLKTNYRGYVGWIAEYTSRTTVDLNTIPIALEYAGDPAYAAFESIAPEVQLAQIDRLVAYLTPIHEVNAAVIEYWRQMDLGNTVECHPPAGNYANFSMSPRDLIELPELRRQTRSLTQAISNVNTSIAAMQRCGVYTPPEIQSAYSKAINAQRSFDLILARMDVLRDEVVNGKAAR